MLSNMLNMEYVDRPHSFDDFKYDVKSNIKELIFQEMSIITSNYKNFHYAVFEDYKEWDNPIEKVAF